VHHAWDVRKRQPAHAASADAVGRSRTTADFESSRKRVDLARSRRTEESPLALEDVTEQRFYAKHTADSEVAPFWHERCCDACPAVRRILLPRWLF
jgi:hypothetical protein